MFSAQQLHDLAMRKLVRQFKPGDMVFRQGDLGKSMYIIVDGMVHVIDEKETQPKLIAMLGKGEILGESAILDTTAYERHFTVQAKSKLVVIEIDRAQVEVAVKIVPDFHFRILKMVLERLENSNRLLTILQVADHYERLMLYLCHFRDFHAKHLPSDTEIGITTREVVLAMSLSTDFVDACFRFLVSKNVLVALQSGYKFGETKNFDKIVPEMKVRIASYGIAA